jgi:hypothetical protein
MSDCEDPNADSAGQFPPDSKPENRVPKISALCSYGMRPHVMTGFLRQLFIGHFSDPENIEEPKLRKQVAELLNWRPEGGAPNYGPVAVESITRWTPQTADKRPAVIIKRNSWKWQKLGIGDVSGSNYVDGSVSYTGMWDGSHTIFCMAPNGVETELLTIELVKLLVRFSPWIREQLSLMRFTVAEVGGVGEVQEVIQGYAVPVTVAYAAEESWSLQPQAPRLKRIVFKASELMNC